MVTDPDCPCGSKRPFSSCCEPYITGKADAPTAEALMRARYSSYATGRIDFIESSQAPEGRESFDRDSAAKWSKESTWLGLRIVAAKDGQPGDDAGVVNFIAAYSQKGEEYEHHEIARFRREGGRWLFVDGESPKPKAETNPHRSIGRNDPCHCGSGKKFKKCHGR